MTTGSRTIEVSNPDKVIFPAEGITKGEVVDYYRVMVPLDRRATFDTVRGFARRVAELLVARHPERLTTQHRKDRRGPRVFLDYFRNGYAVFQRLAQKHDPWEGLPKAAASLTEPTRRLDALLHA